MINPFLGDTRNNRNRYSDMTREEFMKIQREYQTQHATGPGIDMLPQGQTDVGYAPNFNNPNDMSEKEMKELHSLKTMYADNGLHSVDFLDEQIRNKQWREEQANIAQRRHAEQMVLNSQYPQPNGDGMAELLMHLDDYARKNNLTADQKDELRKELIKHHFADDLKNRLNGNTGGGEEGAVEAGGDLGGDGGGDGDGDNPPADAPAPAPAPVDETGTDTNAGAAASGAGGEQLDLERYERGRDLYTSISAKLARVGSKQKGLDAKSLSDGVEVLFPMSDTEIRSMITSWKSKGKNAGLIKVRNELTKEFREEIVTGTKQTAAEKNAIAEKVADALILIRYYRSHIDEYRAQQGGAAAPPATAPETATATAALPEYVQTQTSRRRRKRVGT